MKKYLLFILSFLIGICFFYTPVNAKKMSKKEKIEKTLKFELLKYWKGLEEETKNVKEGKSAGLWKDTEDNDRAETKRIPHNLSKYSAISFWMYSKVANNAKIALVLGSENDETSGGDYFMMRILINWKGWKKLIIPFSEFESMREPVGFNKIDRIRFASTGYKTGGAKEDTLLILDDINFLTPAELKKVKNVYHQQNFKKKKRKKHKKAKSVEDWSE